MSVDDLIHLTKRQFSNKWIKSLRKHQAKKRTCVSEKKIEQCEKIS